MFVVIVVSLLVNTVLSQFTVVDFIQFEPSLTTFNDLLNRSGLTSFLNTAQDITVFAPDNAAFNSSDQTLLNQLYNDIPLLQAFLNYHFLSNRIRSIDMSDGQQLATMLIPQNLTVDLLPDLGFIDFFGMFLRTHHTKI